MCYADDPNLRFLSGRKTKLMLFHGSQDAKVALYPASIVVTNVAFNHSDEFLLTGKTPAIVTLPFQDAP